MSQKWLTILGSTGSIGKNTLDVVERNQAQYKVFALVAGQNLSLLLQQCIVHQPRYALMQNSQQAGELKKQLGQHGCVTQVLDYQTELNHVCQDSQVDIVMSAIVGAAGLLPTLSAIEAGKTVLLANKESLVMSGQLFMDKVRQHNATLLPIDSEHNAIFQCLPADLQANTQQNIQQKGVSKILLTGSGGPFLNRDINTLAEVTVQEAVAHPNWSMGQKISVDSATMMNKGLEFIEAKWLFNANVDDIEVVIHPQSMIHSMVQYVDGSVLAQMGQPDMRTPIAHALAYPKRINAGVSPLNFADMVNFSFHAPDFTRYPNLKLAIEACRTGQAATTTINAANEIAVEAFLNQQIRFTDIYRINAQTLEKSRLKSVTTLAQILQCDQDARTIARQLINEVSN